MNIFQQITEYVKREYSTFDMKNNWIGSINGFGSLNAIYSSIVLPSDTWKLGHNVLVKLPPLISPAFTRIKGIVNSYYCSFASVWNYWNSFISDKPEDAFLSRSLTTSYKGKFVEPCVDFSVIAFICKVARGYYDYSNSTVSWNGNRIDVSFSTMFFKQVPVGATEIEAPTTIVWGYDSNGRRKANFTNNISSNQFEHDVPLPSVQTLTFRDYGSTSVETAEKLGFSDERSYFVWCCQQVERNLSNHGFPTDLIAKTFYHYYVGKFCNLLPFICESSIWHNFYRDEQNQSPEFDYREVNGVIHNTIPYGFTSYGNMPYGWKLRLLGIPPNVSTGSDYWFPVNTMESVFSVLTGYYLEETVRDYLETSSAATTDLNILPKFYNGLLTLKYRNFEKDYFTSAAVDPNYGGVSVMVPNTIDALRTASKLEEFLEVSASARDFYNFMKHIFGTNPESTRYTKPLLLGTQVVPIQVGEQLQTSETSGNSPLGERAGIADGFGNSGTVNHYFNEHGIVVSYLSFVLDSQYMQGMPHEFMHHLQLDYPFPQFANLGAESIPTTEIYFSNNSTPRDVSYLTGDNNAVVYDGGSPSFVENTVDSPLEQSSASVPNVLDRNGLNVIFGTNSTGNISQVGIKSVFTKDSASSPTVFGYTPRYSKWKFKQDVVAGQMRDSLEFWHTFRQFSSQPYISSNFVSYLNAGYLSNLNRIFADTNDNSDKFVCDIFNNGSVRRCLPLVPQTTMD